MQSIRQQAGFRVEAGIKDVEVVCGATCILSPNFTCVRGSTRAMVVVSIDQVEEFHCHEFGHIRRRPPVRHDGSGVFRLWISSGRIPKIMSYRNAFVTGDILSGRGRGCHVRTSCPPSGPCPLKSSWQEPMKPATKGWQGDRRASAAYRAAAVCPYSWRRCGLYGHGFGSWVTSMKVISEWWSLESSAGSGRGVSRRVEKGLIKEENLRLADDSAQRPR